MSEIVSLFTVFSPHLLATPLRQFCRIVFGVLAMTGGVRMRNISTGVNVMKACASPLVVGLLFLFGCASGTPSSSDAEKIIHQYVFEASDERVKVVGFKKTDGQKMEFQGRSVYNLEFQAEAQVTEDCWSYNKFSVHDRFFGRVRFKTEKTQPEERSPMQILMSGETGTMVSRLKGEKTPIYGVVTFEKKESGWVVGRYRILIKTGEREAEVDIEL